LEWFEARSASKGYARSIQSRSIVHIGNSRALPLSQSLKAAMSNKNFPPGWDEARVSEVYSHYERQSEEEQFTEIEAALEAEGITLMAVPTDLVPEVRALLARAQNS
jgi:hypothetical protein